MQQAFMASNLPTDKLPSQQQNRFPTFIFKGYAKLRGCQQGKYDADVYDPRCDAQSGKYSPM